MSQARTRLKSLQLSVVVQHHKYRREDRISSADFIVNCFDPQKWVERMNVVVNIQAFPALRLSHVANVCGPDDVYKGIDDSREQVSTSEQNPVSAYRECLHSQSLKSTSMDVLTFADNLGTEPI